MLNRIFVVDSVTLTSTGTAVSSYTPWDQTTRKLPTQVVVKATGQGAYVRLSNDNSAATNADVLVQGGDHVVLSVQGRRWVSVLSDGASSTVNVGALSTGVSGSAASLDLPFTGVSTLDSSITFTRASSATFVGSNGLIQTAAANAPRFDYDPVTLAARGLLIEEQRTNLLTYSNDFSNAAWVKSTVTETAAAAVSPDGTTNAWALTNTAVGGRVTQGTTATATSHSYSGFAKANTASTVTYLIFNNTTSAIVGQGDVNLSTGAVTQITGTTTAVAAGNGYYRITLTATTGITVGNTITVYIYPGGSSGAIGASIYAYGAQLEAGSFATSYIPTVASQVTRSADVASVNTLSPWYNATEGTIYAEGGGLNALSSARLLSISDNTFANRIINYFANAGLAAGLITTGGVSQANPTVSITSATAVNKVAMGYAANNVNVAANGTLGTLDTSASIPTVTLMRIGVDEVGTGSFLNGTIRRITYYPRRLSNAELQAITA